MTTITIRLEMPRELDGYIERAVTQLHRIACSLEALEARQKMNDIDVPLVEQSVGYPEAELQPEELPLTNPDEEKPLGYIVYCQSSGRYLMGIKATSWTESREAAWVFWSYEDAERLAKQGGGGNVVLNYVKGETR